MTQFVPSGDSNLLPADFDLGLIFIGREQQLDLFHIYLERWQHEMLMAPDIQVTAAPSPSNKLQGLVVLLYGRGGFGKSTLLNHYQEIALQDSQKFIVSGIVDWEHTIEGKRGLFNPAPGREVDAPEYFRFLCTQLAEALKKRPDEFKEYQSAVKAVEDASKQATGVLDNIRKDDRYASLRMLAGPGAITLLNWIAPRVGHALDGAKVTEKVEEVIGQGTQIGAEQLVHAYSKLHDKLGHKLDDYLEPALRLGLALGRDLSHFARNFPLLIFFDTYEEVDEADRLLRLVMGAAGARVGWVVAGRDNLWAGYEQRMRSVGKVYSYKEIVSPRLGLAIDFNVGGVGAFTASNIIEYFSLLRDQVSSQPALPVVTEEGAELILEVTQGVPLAVRIAAGLYLEKTDLAIITEKSDGKREIVDEMVQRYLLHTHDDQDERMMLYGLAMLRRADHPAAITAALGLSPERAKTNYETELSRLQRRYSFIFTEKAQPSLHQEVRHFLRLWLLERRNQPEIIAVNERMKQH
jgi:energy-coupling factor transporter ATP-binding protein EcfA2